LGIGKAIARELAREGVDVAIVARTKAQLEAAARELAGETGQRIISLVADVTSKEQVDEMVAQAVRQLGGLHILVNSGSPAGGATMPALLPGAAPWGAWWTRRRLPTWRSSWPRTEPGPSPANSSWPPGARARRSTTEGSGSARSPAARSADQAVKLPRVLAGHLPRDLGGQVRELLGDVFLRLRPHAIRMRVVRAPHQRLDAHLVDELGAHAVVLKRRLALPAPVLAGLQFEGKILVLVLVLEIHAVDHVGNPADAALAEGDAHVRIALEDGPAHQRGQDIPQRHLEEAEAAVGQRPQREPGVLLAQLRRHRREGVEVQRYPHVVDRLPQRLPDRMPHGVHVPRARQLDALEAQLGDPMHLGDRGLD